MEAKAKECESIASTCSGKEALAHIIAAAEFYMKAAAQSSSALERRRLKKKCEDLIQKAERLKSPAPARESVKDAERRLGLPQQVRQIPTSEKTVLYRNSRLHGNTFPPWESDPDDRFFEGEVYTDKSSFPLSPQQEAIFAGWQRLADITREPTSAASPDGTPSEDTGDYDLVQDITADCSVVASLCAGMRHFRPGPASILPAMMFPVNRRSGRPETSANGRYIFRMFFNGCFRAVVIDDRLPASSSDRTLYVVDRQQPNLFWPALIEKAYLKIRGGYDFPGSNSGTDLCILTGWIPQQIFLQSDDVDFNATWRRIKKAYDYGDVMVTLGTGHLSPDEEEILGLASEHDYAVLDMSETFETRRLLVKNPWCNGLVWKGVGSAYSKPSDQADDHPAKLKPGTFWISFDDVTQNFESLYLNWNPSLFTQRQDYHFRWQLPEPNMVGSFAHNPQYSMTAQSDDQTWILLSRHFQDEELEISRNPIASQSGVSSSLGFMSMYIFDTNGQRVQLSDKAIYRGHFVDSPQTLACLESKKGVKYTIVVAVQDLPLPAYTFTLSFFSRTALSIAPAEHPRKHYAEVQGRWTHRTCGGNSISPNYFCNPQYSLTLPAAGPLSLLISTSKEELPVHVDLVWAKGQRVTSVAVRDLVTTSGDYRRGCALASAPHVDAGTYTVVCSTFEPGQMAEFTLRVGSDTPCVIKPVLADAAGRLRTELPPPTFRAGEVIKVRAPVSVSRLTRVSVVVRTGTGGGRGGAGGGSSSSVVQKNGTAAASTSPITTTTIAGASCSAPGPGLAGAITPRSSHRTIRATLETGREPHRVVLAATGRGEFQEVGLGLRTAECDVDPSSIPRSNGGLWLVIEQMGSSSPDEAGLGSGLQVELYSDAHVQVGPWEAVTDEW